MLSDSLSHVEVAEHYVTAKNFLGCSHLRRKLIHYECSNTKLTTHHITEDSENFLQGVVAF